MTKIISVSDEAYEKLKKLKDKKSFSEIIIELADEGRKNSLLELAGSWTEEDAKKVKKLIYEERKIPSRRFS